MDYATPKKDIIGPNYGLYKDKIYKIKAKRQLSENHIILYFAIIFCYYSV